VRSPEPGQRLAKKHELKWQARDPDKDTLCYDVEVSSDLGESWEDIAEDLRETKHEWDTEEQDDGSYLLRVTASDRLGSPDNPETADAGFVVWVDNTAPSLVLFRGSLAIDDERRASIAGMASDEISPIQSIEYRVGEEEWESAPLSLVESTVAEVAIETAPLDAGEHTLEVRAFDAAGNLATDSVEVTVEADEEEEVDEEAEEEEGEAEDEGAPDETADDADDEDADDDEAAAEVEDAEDEEDEGEPAEGAGEQGAAPRTSSGSDEGESPPGEGTS
jgi:hypothetical protein